MAQTMQCGPLSRAFDLSRATVDEDSRTIELEFSSEAPVERSFGVEVLDHSPQSVRLDRLRNGAPFLLDHASLSSEAQVGVVERAEIENGKGKATVRFSKSARAQEILEDIKDGIRRKISVGYRIHRFDLIRGKGEKPDEYRATDWEPFEISLVPVPADDSVGVRAEDNPFLARSAQLTTTATIMQTDTAPEAEAIRAEAEPQAPAPAPVAERSIETAPVPAQPDPEAVRAAALAEADRRDEIRALAAAHGIEDAKAKEAIRSGASVEAFKLSVFDALAERNKPMNIPQSDQPAESAKPGSRAHMLDSFARSAKSALGSRGANILIPRYADERLHERNYVDGNGTAFHRSLAGAPTLVDVAALDAGIGYPIIEEVSVQAREVEVFPVDTISGASIELSVLKDLPSVGFRAANEGRTRKKAEHETRIFQTQVIEEPIEVDIQGVLNASKDPGRFLAAQARAVTLAALKHIGIQTWYGQTSVGADTKAPPGLILQSETGATHTVDATGSTAKSSVFMVELGTNAVHHIYGNDTTLNISGDWRETDAADASGGILRVLQTWLSGRVAPVLANKDRFIRIKNLGTDTDKGLTDLLLAEGYRKAGELGFTPNAIFMSWRSVEQLQKSRTAYHPSGAPVPMPTEFYGIPIYPTNSISNNEGTV